jgi:SAM-dependent methyltransferase
METPIYNSIGTGYNDSRKADPYIASRMLANLQPTKDGKYIDVGCGTGNYTALFIEAGFSFTGIEPSDVMLNTAKKKMPDSVFIRGVAEELPLDDNSCDGVVAMLTLHHWHDQQKGLSEIFRVLKPGSRFVLLSFTPEQTKNYWLVNYFPTMIEHSADVVPGEDTMTAMLRTAGFSHVETEKYFVQEGLLDNFLYANKFKPEKYLDPATRKNISTFSLYANKEMEDGLKMLEDDITSGNINSIIARYLNDLGDYLFYVAVKF